MSQTVELAGEVVGEAGTWAVADVGIEGAGVDGGTHRYRASFDLRLDDGRRVTIETAGSELAGGHKGTRRGTWAQLHEGDAQLLGSFAAGPHFKLQLNVVGFRGGDRVTVLGVQVPSLPDASVGYRESAHRDSEVVRASRVIGAELIEKQHDERVALARPPARGQQLRLWDVPYLLTLAVSPFVVLACVVAPLPSGGHDAVIRGSWISLGLVLAWHASARFRGYPQFHGRGTMFRFLPGFTAAESWSNGVRGPKPARLGYWSIMTVFMMSVTILPMVLFPSWAGEDKQGDVPGMTYFTGTLFFVIAAAWVVIPHLWMRAPLRRVRSMLAAARREGNEDGWRSIEGTIAEPLSASVYVRWRSVTNALQVATFSGNEFRGDIAIDTADRGRVSVEGVGCVWATSAWRNEMGPPSGGDASASECYRLEAPAGAAALLVGYFQDGKSNIVADGPESVLLFATDAGVSARELLRKACWNERIPWILWLIGAAYAVATGALI